MPKKDGLRERKKEATRAALSQIATQLFMERGFDYVTVAEIAEAANVAKMTVFNYFPRKEDLFFDREEEGRELARTALAERPHGEPPVATLGGLARRLVEARHPFAKFNAGTAQFWGTVSASPALTARAREMRDEFIRDLAEMMAATLSRPKYDPPAHLAAAMFISAWHVGSVEAYRQLRIGAKAQKIHDAFLEVLNLGLRGITAALKGTPYV